MTATDDEAYMSACEDIADLQAQVSDLTAHLTAERAKVEAAYRENEALADLDQKMLSQMQARADGAEAMLKIMDEQLDIARAESKGLREALLKYGRARVVIPAQDGGEILIGYLCQICKAETDTIAPIPHAADCPLSSSPSPTGREEAVRVVCTDGSSYGGDLVIEFGRIGFLRIASRDPDAFAERVKEWLPACCIPGMGFRYRVEKPGRWVARLTQAEAERGKS